MKPLFERLYAHFRRNQAGSTNAQMGKLLADELDKRRAFYERREREIEAMNRNDTERMRRGR